MKVIFYRAIREEMLDSRHRNLAVTVELLKGHLVTGTPEMGADCSQRSMVIIFVRFTSRVLIIVNYQS